MLKALVVGLGQIGMGYDLNLTPDEYVLTHARAFQQHPDFYLSGGVDADAKRCELFKAHYGRPVFTNLAIALKETQPDVVVIAVPTQQHKEMIQQVFHSWKPKAILCEKPLAYEVGEARSILELCQAQNCSLYVNYMRRSTPGAIEIKRRLEKSLMAMPVKGMVWYSKGLLHNASHFFNIIQYWLGDMQEFKVIAPGRLWDGIDPEPDIQVKFTCGNITFLAAQEENFSHYTIELVAPNGRLRYDRGGERISWQEVIKDPVVEGYKSLMTSEQMIEPGMARSQWHVVDQLAANLKNVSTQICTGAEAFKTLQSLSAIRSQL